VRGNLRLEDSQNNTIAESDLEADLFGKLLKLEERIHELGDDNDNETPPGTRELVSGVLEARRVSSLTCVVINKSGGPVDNVAITLKHPNGPPLVGPEECDGVPHGGVCSLTYDIVLPDLDVAAYCHATVPEDKFLVGNLRYENSQSATHAQSPLEGDLHGFVRELIEDVEEVEVCSFPGDGQNVASFPLPAPSTHGVPLAYEDCGDGTIVDLNTGFMWEKKVAGGTDGTTCLTAPHGVESQCTWAQATGAWLTALNTEGGTGYAGYTDWGLPDVKKLQSILNFANLNPAIDAAFGLTKANFHWSATTRKNLSTSAWNVSFFDGMTRDDDKTNVRWVRAVRIGSCP
jgi:hypothetical protein